MSRCSSTSRRCARGRRSRSPSASSAGTSSPWSVTSRSAGAEIGDGNNVAASLAHAAAMLGVHLHVASPEAYQLPDAVVRQATRVARHGARLRLFNEPADASAGVDAIYTDTWTSMGQETE